MGHLNSFSASGGGISPGGEGISKFRFDWYISLEGNFGQYNKILHILNSLHYNLHDTSVNICVMS